jgi:hypothetical protein
MMPQVPLSAPVVATNNVSGSIFTATWALAWRP